MERIIEVLPDVMYNIMVRQDNECLIGLILDYPHSVVIQTSASKILKERDIGVDELFYIIHSIGKKRIGDYSTQLTLDFPEECVHINNVQLELNLKGP